MSYYYKKIRKYLWRPVAVAKSPLRAFRPGNIVMFHIGRCGSTVLGNLLNQHPNVFWDGEIYEKFKVKSSGLNAIKGDPIGLLKSRMNLAGRRFYGFEIKFLQQQHLDLIHFELDGFIDQLLQLGYLNFIILERRNYLKRNVSHVIGQTTKKYHQPEQDKAQLTRVEIDVNKLTIGSGTKTLIEWLYEFRSEYLHLQKLLEEKNCLYLTYENDILSNPRAGYHRICNFLNIQPVKVDLKNSKTNPFEPVQVVINYNEVKDRLSGTPFEWMTSQ